MNSEMFFTIWSSSLTNRALVAMSPAGIDANVEAVRRAGVDTGSQSHLAYGRPQSVRRQVRQSQPTTSKIEMRSISYPRTNAGHNLSKAGLVGGLPTP